MIKNIISFKSVVAVLSIAIWVLVFEPALGQTYDTAVPAGENYDTAEFRLWLPEGLQSIRAVLVLVPGSNGDGRNQVENELWQQLAEEQDLALVGIHMTDKMHEDMFIEHYVNVSGGSGAALLSALDTLAGNSGRPEVATVPLLLWGMSAGGEFNYEFALWRPARVAGFVVNKGGIYYSALAPGEARRVPGLFFVGTEDLAFRNDIVRGIYSVNRRAHALWALIEQQGIGHEIAGSDIIAAEFYRQVLAERLASDGTLNGLEIADGFYCDPATVECHPAATSDAPRKPVSWLANDSLAEIWKRAHLAGMTD